MPDIAMCKGENCPLRYKCYRHKATPSMWQSYWTGTPYNKKTKSCSDFIPMSETKRKRVRNANITFKPNDSSERKEKG